MEHEWPMLVSVRGVVGEVERGEWLVVAFLTLRSGTVSVSSAQGTGLGPF